MNSVAFSDWIESPWVEMEPIRIGCATADFGVPDRYVLIKAADEPVLRIDLYRSSGREFAFEAAASWAQYIAIGWGQHLYLVQPNTRGVIAFDLGSYFGDMYPTESHLLVASSERVFCFTQSAVLAWKTEILGIDGVIVYSIENDIIQGEGEWDPPDGWEPFAISLQTGQKRC